MTVNTERRKESDSAGIEAAAGDWLALRDSDNWTDEARLRFDQWLNESTLHRVAFLRLESVWERSARLQALGAGRVPGKIPPPGSWEQSVFASVEQRPGWTSRGVGLKACAAAAALFVVLGVGFELWPQTSYRTAVGGLASVPMTDGSKITLNTDSQIRVEVDRHERRVDLERGEAFFEVAKDATRPFVVHVGNTRVVAVGTQFSIRREADDLEVVVTEGKVRIESSGAPQAVAAGMVARASDAGILLKREDPVQAEESLSWRRGTLVFKDATLADAVAEFNRYNTHKIVIDDASVGALEVAGSFRADNVEAFVRLLARGYPVRVERQDDELVIKAR
jgi:transmembrane sensor